MDRFKLLVWKGRKIQKATFHYLYIIHLCFLGEDGGYINAVEATGQYTDDKKVKDEADKVNPTLLLASAICYFLLDPLFFQIRLRMAILK